MAVDGEHAALVVEFVEHRSQSWTCSSSSSAFSQTCFRRSTRQSIQRHGSVPIRNPVFIVTPMRSASTPCFARDRLHRFGRCGRNQDARRAFVEQQRTPAAGRVSSSIDAPMPFAERALRQRHRQAAIAQIVRRLGQARVDDLANRRLHALFVVHVERRRQSPHLLQDHLGVLRAAEAHRRRTSPSPPSSITVRPAS